MFRQFIGAAVSLWLTTTAMTAAAQDYPVIFHDADAQREFGVYNARFGAVGDGRPLANKCFYYGVNSQLLSLSDGFLAPYLAKGFSLRSLCMAMVSGLTHHPETGARLATIMSADVENGEVASLGAEIMVEVPDCFRRGLPLTDCEIRYGPDGAPLPEDVVAEIARSGQFALEAGRGLLAGGAFSRPCAAAAVGGECFIETFGAIPAVSDPDHEGAGESGQADPGAGYFAREWAAGDLAPDLLPFGGFADFSPAHEEGFAYALFAYGGLVPFGPSEASITAEGLAIAGKNRANSAVIESLKARLKN